MSAERKGRADGSSVNSAAASTERESLVYDGEQVCAACPVASGECPRCHTFWVMRADGKRFGFRANARIVSLLAGTGDDSGLDSTAAATLQAYVDQKWADVTDRGTQPTPPVPPSDAATIRGWRVEQYRGRFVVCDGPLEVWGTNWAARFDETADAERFADAMNEWESVKPQASNFGNNSWA